MKDIADHVFDALTARLRLIVDDDAMAQHRARDLGDVIATDREAIVEQAADLGRQDQPLDAAGRSTERHATVDQVRRIGAARLRGHHQPNGIGLRDLRNGHLPHYITQRTQLARIADRVDRHRRAAGRPIDDRVIVRLARVADDQLEQEAIELRLGQRVGALLIDGILRRHHAERLGHRDGAAPHRHLALLHHFEQRGLRLGRRTVDFVGEHQIGDDRALLERKLMATARRLGQHGRADNVGGHHVGRELDTREWQVDRAADRADQHRLAQARHTFKQDVPARHQRGKHAIDHITLTDHHALHRLADAAERRAEGICLFTGGLRRVGHLHGSNTLKENDSSDAGTGGLHQPCRRAVRMRISGRRAFDELVADTPHGRDLHRIGLGRERLAKT